MDLHSVSLLFAENAFRLANHPFERLRARIRPIDFRNTVEISQQCIWRNFRGVGTLGQRLAKRARGRGKSESWAGLLQRAGFSGVGHRPFLFMKFGRAGDFIANSDDSNRTFPVWIDLNSVEGVTRFCGADLSGIN